VYLGDASVLTDVMLMEATVLIDLATNFASTFMALESMDEMEEIEELIETSQAAAEKLEAERKTRPNLSALDANDTFYASLKGVDVNQLKAIESQYGYDQLYNYDSLVRDFVNNKLQLGVT
jgi:ABC-type microcin C transport system permease subunit YejB